MVGILNDFITFIFLIELSMKVIVYGLVMNGRFSYLRDGWNILDAIIVTSNIASFVIDRFTDQQSEIVKNLELLKMLRVLRSMRLFTRIEGVKLSVLTLIYALPGIINVTVVSVLFFLLFGIFFLNLFKGSFYHCKLVDPVAQG